MAATEHGEQFSIQSHTELQLLMIYQGIDKSEFSLRLVYYWEETDKNIEKQPLILSASFPQKIIVSAPGVPS